MRTFLTFLILSLAFPAVTTASWDFSRHAIPLSEIRAGGPPRDGIPALFNPEYVPATDADYMRDNERVLGVYRNGVARAYPIRVLSWHELVNENFGDEPLLVSW